MLNLELRHIVASIVQSELRGKGREKEALYFNFDLQLSQYEEYETYDERCGLHLLYHCKPHCSYISVFTGVTENPFAGIDKVKWEHGITHDSGWRDISTFWNVYIGMANKINERLLNDGLKKAAPRAMVQHNIVRKELFKWVSVEVNKDPWDDYRKIVTIL